MTTQKKAGRPAKKKTAAQDPAKDPINNPSSDIDQDLDNDDSDDDEDDFDASTESDAGAGDTDTDENQPPAPPEKPVVPVKQATQKKAGTTAPVGFEEWMVDIKGGKADKLKKLRDNVKISEFEAETLNHGALGQINASRHIMYFKPGQS